MKNIYKILLAFIAIATTILLCIFVFVPMVAGNDMYVAGVYTLCGLVSAGIVAGTVSLMNSKDDSDYSDMDDPQQRSDDFRIAQLNPMKQPGAF